MVYNQPTLFGQILGYIKTQQSTHVSRPVFWEGSGRFNPAGWVIVLHVLRRKMKIPITALLIIALASGCSTTSTKEKNERPEMTELYAKEQTLDSLKTGKNEAEELFSEWVETRGNYRHFRKPEPNNLYIQLILHPYGEEQFLKGLHHKNQWIRDLSETALAGKNSDYFREQMSRLAIEGGDFERETAIKALVNTRDPRTAGLLIDRLQNDPWAQNRENSANYLRFFPSNETSEALLSSLTDEERVAAAAMKTLSLHKEKRFIFDGREALFRIQHPQLLRNSIEAYSLIGSPDALEIIVERLSIEEDDDWVKARKRYQKQLEERRN